VRERTWLRIFGIEANRDSLFGNTAIDFNFSRAAACAFWIVAKQNAEHAEEGTFKIYRFGWLLSLIVGSLCRFHNVSSNYDTETGRIELDVWTVNAADRTAVLFRLSVLSGFPTKASTYLVPDGKVGHDAFAVIRETIRNPDMVAIGRVVLTSREHIIGLEPLDNGL
jgi:hypothetical protein